MRKWLCRSFAQDGRGRKKIPRETIGRRRGMGEEAWEGDEGEDGGEGGERGDMERGEKGKGA